MPQDAVNYMFLAEELDMKLKKGRIEKITMDEKANVMIFVHANGKTHNLIITTAESPRCYLTKSRVTGTNVPLSFALHLRKHIGNGIIEKAECEPFERILRFYISAKDELGEYKNYILTVELMGKYSNIVLSRDDFTITESLKHIPISESHPVLPGLKYEMPTFLDKPIPTDPAADEFSDITDLGTLIGKIRGVARLTAKEIRYIAKNESVSLSEAARILLKKPAAPVVYFGPDGKVCEYSFVKFDSENSTAERKASLSEAMDAYYLPKEAEKSFTNESAKLKRIVTAYLEKQKRKLGTFLSEEASAKDYQSEKLTGDLITANIYKVRKGDGQLEAVNWETGETVKIKLTEATPQEDAQKHFRRYQKKKRTLEALASQIQSVKDEIEYLESVIDNIAAAVSADDLKDIAEEIENIGLIKIQRVGKKDIESKPRIFIIDGFTVYAGKSNIQNDKLTKSSRGEDIWLHTQGIHGSHVVIKTNGAEVPQETLVKVASVAAFFSKARQSENVPVDWTKVKNVHKPKGAVPGKVDYFGAKTLFVSPKLPPQ